jgi:hypothetical protein
MDEEAVLIGIDVRHARMAALVMKPARRDHAVEQVVRRARTADARRGRIVGRRPGARHLVLIVRGLTIGREVSARLLRPAWHGERFGERVRCACAHAGGARDERALEKDAPVENAVAGRRLGEQFDFAFPAHMGALLGEVLGSVPRSVA